MRATKILILEKGRIVEAGSHSELTKKQGRYWALLSTQTRNRPKNISVNKPFLNSVADNKLTIPRFRWDRILR